MAAVVTPSTVAAFVPGVDPSAVGRAAAAARDSCCAVARRSRLLCRLLTPLVSPSVPMMAGVFVFAAGRRGTLGCGRSCPAAPVAAVANLLPCCRCCCFAWCWFRSSLRAERRWLRSGLRTLGVELARDVSR
eukprot:COSAG05_NODE_445_length_9773_cov_4.588071_7_plen_132_part_00